MVQIKGTSNSNSQTILVDSDSSSSSSDEDEILFGKNRKNLNKNSKSNQNQNQDENQQPKLTSNNTKPSKEEIDEGYTFIEEKPEISKTSNISIIVNPSIVPTSINSSTSSTDRREEGDISLNEIKVSNASKDFGINGSGTETNAGDSAISKKKGKDKDKYVHGSVFDPLPDEVVICIYSHLDVPSIAKLSQVNKRFRDLGDDVPMWKDLSTKRSYLTNNGGVVSNNLTKSFYIRKFKSFKKRQELKRQEEIRSKKDLQRRKNMKRFVNIVYCIGFARPYEWISTISLLLVTIFTILKLDGVISWNWVHVFIPFYFMVAHMIIAPLVYDIGSVYYDEDFEQEFTPEKNGIKAKIFAPIFYFGMWVLTLGERSNFSIRFLIYSFTTTVSLFVVMYGVKAGKYLGDSHFPWWVVFLPLLFECLVGIATCIIGIGSWEPIWYDEKWVDRFFLILLIIPFFIFLLFCALKLDGRVTWDWFRVMIPLFILEGFLVMIPILLTIMTLCCSYSVKHSTRWHNDSGFFCGSAAVFQIVILVPLLTFQILLAQRTQRAPDDQLSFKLIFTPLLLLEGIAVVGCVVMNIVMQFN